MTTSSTRLVQHVKAPRGAVYRPADNEMGWRMSLEKLAEYVEEAIAAAPLRPKMTWEALKAVTREP